MLKLKLSILGICFIEFFYRISFGFAVLQNLSITCMMVPYVSISYIFHVSVFNLGREKL